MKSDDHVIVLSLDHYKYVPKILDETPKHVLANYFSLLIATEFGRYTSRQYKNISDQYIIDNDLSILGKNQNTLFGIKKYF